VTRIAKRDLVKRGAMVDQGHSFPGASAALNFLISTQILKGGESRLSQGGGVPSGDTPQLGSLRSTSPFKLLSSFFLLLATAPRMGGAVARGVKNPP